jgi:hypothetical protein
MRATARTAACAVALLGAGVAFTASAAEAAKPVVGSVSGPITSVKGARFTLTTTLSPTGTSTVSVGSKTVITEQVPGTIADVKKGACVTALGQKSATGTIAATRITLTQPVKGQCTGGFGRRPGGGRPPNAPPRGSGAGRPSGRFGGGFANFGFAFGEVSAAKGDTVTVKGSQGSTTVALSKKTQVGEVKRLGSAAIDPKLCAFVQGTSGNRGVTVAATAVGLSKPVSGSCTGRFRQR